MKSAIEYLAYKYPTAEIESYITPCGEVWEVIAILDGKIVESIEN